MLKMFKRYLNQLLFTLCAKLVSFRETLQVWQQTGKLGHMTSDPTCGADKN